MHIVQYLIVNTWYLGNKPHPPSRPIELRRENVVHHPTSVTDLEAARLDATDLREKQPQLRY